MGFPPLPNSSVSGGIEAQPPVCPPWVMSPDPLVCCQDSGPQGRRSTPSRVELTEIFLPWRFCAEVIGEAEMRPDSQACDPGSATHCLWDLGQVT